MRLTKPLGILLLFLISASVARADKVTADYDHSVNFFKFKTFMWIHPPEPEEVLMKDRIIAAINEQLTGRGLRQVNDGADLALGANIATEERYTWNTYYSGDDWWGGGWATTQVNTHEVGTLTVDLFDAKSRKLIWEGVATDELPRKPEKKTRNIYKQVAKMFRHYPPIAEP